MTKVLFGLLGLPVGLYAGAYIGSILFRVLIGRGGHMDASGFLGALFGAPVGAAVAGLIGVMLGTAVDRRFGSRPGLLAAVGAVAGASIGWSIASTIWDASRGTVPHFTWAWVGAIAGFALVALVSWLWHQWNRLRPRQQ